MNDDWLIVLIIIVVVILAGCGELRDITHAAEDAEVRCNQLFDKIELCFDGALMVPNGDGTFTMQCL